MTRKPPSPLPTSLSPGQFSATVSAISSAFGDPTRREIYLLAHDTPGGVTAAQVAERFGLHPNVARHHLDKLAAGGYLEAAVERPQGAGAGRPSKHYRPTGEPVELEVPVRTDELILALLGKALAALAPDVAERIAEEVGTTYGRAIASGFAGQGSAPAHRSLRSALHAVADAMTAFGFGAHAEERDDRLRIVNAHCPFGDAAVGNPVLCAVDRGMIKGMLAGLYGDVDPTTEASLAHGDTFCSTAI